MIRYARAPGGPTPRGPVWSSVTLPAAALPVSTASSPWASSEGALVITFKEPPALPVGERIESGPLTISMRSTKAGSKLAWKPELDGRLSVESPSTVREKLSKPRKSWRSMMPPGPVPRPLVTPER